MLEALIKVWPLLAGMGAASFALLGWIAVGVWRVSSWTATHDSRVKRLEVRTHDLEQTTHEHSIAIARLEAKQ